MRFLAAATALLSFACGSEPTDSIPPPKTSIVDAGAATNLTIVPSALGQVPFRLV
jgi:hypothetical protein